MEQYTSSYHFTLGTRPTFILLLTDSFYDKLYFRTMLADKYTEEAGKGTIGEARSSPCQWAPSVCQTGELRIVRRQRFNVKVLVKVWSLASSCIQLL